MYLTECSNISSFPKVLIVEHSLVLFTLCILYLKIPHKNPTHSPVMMALRVMRKLYDSIDESANCLAFPTRHVFSNHIMVSVSRMSRFFM